MTFKVEAILANPNLAPEQPRRLQEECGELIAAINHYLRKDRKSGKTEVVMEMTHVVCTLATSMNAFGITEDEINDGLSKLNRRISGLEG